MLFTRKCVLQKFSCRVLWFSFSGIVSDMILFDNYWVRKSCKSFLADSREYDYFSFYGHSFLRYCLFQNFTFLSEQKSSCGHVPTLCSVENKCIGGRGNFFLIALGGRVNLNLGWNCSCTGTQLGAQLGAQLDRRQPSPRSNILSRAHTA